MAARNDDGLYAKARSLFISKATMDDLTGRATPRQTDAASRPFDTEPANGERSKRERLLRRARFPVVKSLDGYDFSNVRLPDGYALDGLLDLDFVPCAQDLVFYCLCSISCCGFSHDDFSGLGRACRPRNGLNWMVLVSPPERTGKDYDQHAPSTVYPSFAAERGIRRVDRAENTCQRADGA